jgi:uncharacterized membrane protein YagU involved in acid resistance
MAAKTIDTARPTSTVEGGEPVAAEIYPYRAGITGGLIAGAVMVVVMAAWGMLTGRSIWFPVNLISAAVLPWAQTASPEALEAFNPAAAVVGTLIHFGISMLLGLLFALVLPTLPGSTLLWGIVVGTLLYVGAHFALLPLVNPRMYELVSDRTFLVAHIAFSVVLGWWVTRQPTLAPHD